MNHKRSNKQLHRSTDQHLKLTHYSPDSGILKPRQLIRELAGDLKQAHQLGMRLAKRNIKGQYRQSFLGYFWSVIPPLITSLVWVFLNSQKVVNIDDPGVPYPLFVLIGTMLWQVFNESVQAPLKGVSSGKSMLAKINFPRESLIMSGLYESGFNTLIKLGLIIMILLIYQYYPPLTAIFALAGIISIMILGSTIGILLTPLGMLYRDVQRAIAVVMQFAIYLTPVIYPEPRSGLAAQLMQFNPVAPLLTTTRNLFLGNPLTGLNEFIIYSAISLVIFMVGLFFYRLAMPIIIERVGA